MTTSPETWTSWPVAQSWNLNTPSEWTISPTATHSLTGLPFCQRETSRGVSPLFGRPQLTSTADTKTTNNDFDRCARISKLNNCWWSDDTGASDDRNAAVEALTRPNLAVTGAPGLAHLSQGTCQASSAWFILSVRSDSSYYTKAWCRQSRTSHCCCLRTGLVT